ncbi:MAG TPA: peptidylprolyl isomerase [Candidatus Kapabacteria bacterium]|nr:peptidylprolyl isomerase [Candidatus Kapabacteria bacterium]
MVAAAASAQTSQLRDGDNLDAVIAVVGKYPILRSNIDAQVQLAIFQAGKHSVSADTLAALRKQVLESEIDQKAMLVKAESDTLIVVTESEIDDQLNDRIKQYQRQFGTQAEMEKAFGKTVAEIRASQDLRDKAREQLYIERLRQEKFSKPPVVSRRDVQEFYAAYHDSLPAVSEQVELATIVKLIKPKTGELERVRALAKRLADSLHNNGADFADLAKRYSQHSTASSGGDLGGPYPRGTFISDFEAAAFKLKPGEVSDPVETDQGIHIIKMIERRGEEIHVAQILLKASASQQDEDSIRAVINAIRDSALNGADFARLARSYSDDQETKQNGGYLGKVGLTDLGAEQREVLDSMQSGDISRPIKISFSKTVTGFQIVKLIRRVPSHKPTYETDYRELEYAATQWKQIKDYQKFVADARKDVYVDIR